MAPKPADEAARLAALHRYNILDTPPEEAFDRITQIAADLFNVPIALVSLVDEHRQWFKSRVGLEATETSRDLAFCAHAILGDDICMVPDTLQDDRFATNPLVLGDPEIRFYAGAPLITSDGYRIGTLCIISRQPRAALTLKERRLLQNLAAMAVREIETRLEVSRRAATEVALRESDSRFRGAFETSPNGMAIVSPEGHFLQVNAALVRILGYDEADLLGEDFRTLTYAEDLESDLAQLRALLTGHIPDYSMEKRFVRKDGSVIWTLLSVALVRDVDGQPLHFVSQIKDIQHRKNNEAQIEALVMRNRLAVEAGEIGIWEWNIDTNRHHWDAQTRRHFGLTEGIPNSLSAVLDFLHPDDREPARRVLEEAMLAASSYEFEHRVIWPSGAVRHIQVKAKIIRDESGKPIRLIGTSTDVTELREAKEEAERASRAKSEFLTIMSHELRTPMNGILGFAQLLDAQMFGKLNEKQKEFADAILTSGHHLLKLIDEVLELSKIEAGKLAISMEPVELLPVCKAVVASLGHLADRAGIEIEPGNFGLDLPPVLVDRTRLSQCLFNIGSNAIKYNQFGGKVRFAFDVRSDGTVRIAITDTGFGIPEHRLAELFQPFSRLGAEQKAIEGTGVGLALSQKLATMMGGAIGVASEEGKGSTFWIDLQPYRPTGDESPLPVTPHIFPSLQDGFKLLYVEDNPMNRLLMTNICTALNDVELIEADDAASGLHAANRDLPDIIVLDINLPDRNGFAVLQELHGNPQLAETPVIALSANAMPDQIRRGLQAGFFQYLSKPIDVATFIGVIAAGLEASRLTRQRRLLD